MQMTLLGRASGWTGRQLLQGIEHYAQLVTFWVDVVSVWQKHRYPLNRASYTTLLNQFIFTGIDAVPVFTLIALTFGMGVTTQLVFVVHTVGDAQDTANFLIDIIALELGPLITAIILIGRSGSAITVDLGNMKVKGEIEGMELLGINVHDVLILPRMISTAFSQVVLASYFTFLILASGILFSGFLFNASSAEYTRQVFLILNTSDVVVFFVKNLIFGGMIGATACYHGLSVGLSTTEVPQQTHRALVTSITLVFMLDVLVLLASR